MRLNQIRGIHTIARLTQIKMILTVDFKFGQIAETDKRKDYQTIHEDVNDQIPQSPQMRDIQRVFSTIRYCRSAVVSSHLQPIAYRDHNTQKRGTLTRLRLQLSTTRRSA
jgi:hypothetical protein